MAYVGVDINYGSIASQTAVSGGSTTPIATLDYSVPTSSSIIVTLSGVTQVPGVDFNVTSGTTLTFTSSVPATVVVCVYFLGRSVDIGTPGSGTVGISQLTASGTASSSTFLRGDNSWASAGGPSLGSGNEIIRTNSDQINQNITIPSGTNGLSAAPITIGSSFTVTVNGTWTIAGA
jgi:hypothetical protein